MPNYSLVVNSVYDPFTFDELIKPYQIYGEAYKEQEEKYNQLAEDSAKWGDQLSPDSEAYRMWNEFETGINDAASQLIARGLTPATRGAMSQVRQSYGKNIKAIEAANDAYQKALTLRGQVQGNDGSVKYKTGISIDDYLHGKTGSTEYLSGAKLRAETADMAEKLGTAIYSNPNFDKVMDNYYWQIGMQKGAPAAMLEYIQDPVKMAELKANATKEGADANDVKLFQDMQAFANLYNSQLSRTDGYSVPDQEELNNQIYQGMYSGLAKPAYDYQRNLGKMTAGEAASNALGRDQLKEQKREFDLTHPTDETNDGSSSSSSSSGRGNTPNARVAAYTQPVRTTGSGTYILGMKDGKINIKGKKVEVREEDGQYVLYAGKARLGSYKPSEDGSGPGTITITAGLRDDKDFKEYFGCKYDGSYDGKYITNILNQVKEIEEKESAGGYKNYDFYLDPDNTKTGNEDGGSTLVPKSREMLTMNNLLGLIPRDV